MLRIRGRKHVVDWNDGRATIRGLRGSFTCDAVKAHLIADGEEELPTMEPTKRRRSYKREVRSLMGLNGGKCTQCGCDLVMSRHGLERYPRNMATLDHVIPLKKGGDNVKSNYRLVCRACNQNIKHP